MAGCPARRAALLVAAALVAAAIAGAAVPHDVHPEQEAQHVTPLRRRMRRRPPSLQDGAGEEFGAGSVLEDEMANITTSLRFMTAEYEGEIGVGTAPGGGPLFRAAVVFDTGSTNLWVASVLCRAGPCAGGAARAFYDPRKSVTQEEADYDGNDITVKFGTGELVGPLHVDTYHVGPMRVNHQPFAMIREMRGRVFEEFPFEGILGLGFPSLSFGGIEPFLERVIRKKALTRNEFAFYMNADVSKPSAVLWGGVDQALYERPMLMFPVVQPHYWALDLLDFSIGNESFGGFGGEHVRRLVVDTGTLYFTAPHWMFHRVRARLPSALCSEVRSGRLADTFPPLVYTLRNANGCVHRLEIPAATYMVGHDAVSANMLEDGTCSPAFMKMDVPREFGPAMLMGEVFLRSFFTVFSRGDGDVKNAKIGFAKAKLGAIPRDVSEPNFLQSADEAAAADAVLEEQLASSGMSLGVEASADAAAPPLPSAARARRAPPRRRLIRAEDPPPAR